ncbi:LOW QUALITY PROTEIN: protein S100-A11 [Cebidichthys violaceus]|uniref:LOW QUALITY PROTEIN: protein S100-A11 n=1 Tax=Cebidichthys violaceus TaxID=271503 RepID=UPI0035CAC5C3
MCASEKGDEAYIFRGDGQSGGTRLLAPAVTHPSISTQKVSAQTIMEAAICTIVTQFKTYAGKDGSSSTLSKDEFHILVTSQLPNYVKNAADPGAIEQLMGSLDENNDGELNFSEFWQLIGKLASKQGGFSQ